jgi:hypothetical protein
MNLETDVMAACILPNVHNAETLMAYLEVSNL